MIAPSGPHLSLDLAEAEDVEKILAKLKALSSKPRLKILELLKDKVCNVSEIAEALDMPLSTANLHIKGLEDAGLLMSDLKPGTRGLQKVCSRVYDTIIIKLPHGQQEDEQFLELNMPVGAYVDCQVEPTCGLASESGIIGLFDDPASFYEPNRISAQLLWFHHGYVEYRFPNRLPPKVEIDSLQISLEIASEAPLHHDNWPSDISMWINEVEIGSWTSPRDFGGQRGTLTPKWWEEWNSQYGLLKIWQVNGQGTMVDGLRISDVVLDDLQIDAGQEFISMRIGVKRGAEHVGGLNLFGRKFGNYPQDILMRIRYH